MYKNYLFDVDGTLLPMNTKEFAEIYLKSICRHIAPSLGVEPQLFGKAVWSGTMAMLKNNGQNTNEKVFWQTLSDECGAEISASEDLFNDYYNSEKFDEVRVATEVNPFAKKSVEYLKANGGRLIAATNPIFPKEATFRRLEWAGVSPNDFDYITVYDNSSYCKPNPKYFEGICEKCCINPEESIMIGNDVDEDLCSAQLGFDTFLVTDCIINRQNKDISGFKSGTFEELYSFITK